MSETKLSQLSSGWNARDYNPGATPVPYPDPDVLVLDGRFTAKIGNTPIQRLWTGALWAEGPAWCGGGRYLLWSDIPNNRQMRRLDESGHVSVFRQPSGNSNGNTFDWQGRQISCQHEQRRVVRYEHDGSVTVLADSFDGKPLNSPNDVVVHPDGGVWFTDPPYGSLGNYEGLRGEIHLKEAVYRIDPHDGGVAMVTDEADKPNGLCFSPDYSRLYLVDSGAPRNITVWEVVDGRKLGQGEEFTDYVVDGVNVGPDGVRTDVDGNVWTSGSSAEPGYSGVHAFAANGDRIGQIRLPEACANLCFGGRHRNRLFMTASQSLYAVYVNTQGAHVA